MNRLSILFKAPPHQAFKLDSIYLDYQRKHHYTVDSKAMMDLHKIIDIFAGKLVNNKARDVQLCDFLRVWMGQSLLSNILL
jgi:hypothetical protein